MTVARVAATLSAAVTARAARPCRTPRSSIIRRTPTRLAAIATLAIALAACNGGFNGPTLTDPTAIVTAALASAKAAKTVHLDLTAEGKASIPLPIGGSANAPIDLTGATASADVDLAKGAGRATFSLPSMLSFAGELIALDGKSYIKTTLTGPPTRRPRRAARRSTRPRRAGCSTPWATSCSSRAWC